MRLRQQFLTKNDCYKAGRTIAPRGVMVHSTGANNPNVKRYVPGNAELGKNTNGNHWDATGIEKCVHAFVGKFADGKVGTVQTLPWNRRGWHAGKGTKGSANDTHISFEICEDGLTDPVYFSAVYQEAVELTAMLCREYKLDPLADGVVICHQEGYRRGIASNHGDVLHWFPKHGKTMDDFRADVARIMKGEDDMTEAQVKQIAQEVAKTVCAQQQTVQIDYSQFRALMEQYRKELGQLPAPSWAVKNGELDQAVKMDITDGSRPQDLASRVEVAAMIVRAAKK